MKSFLSLLLTLSLMFSLTGCVTTNPSTIDTINASSQMISSNVSSTSKSSSASSKETNKESEVISSSTSKK